MTVGATPPIRRAGQGAREDRDAFGLALWEWSNGGLIPETVQRDDGFTQIGAGAEVYLSTFKEWPAAERNSLQHVRGRVLDVGCGAGRVALELQRRGHEVVGLDSSPLAVRAAKKCGVDKVVCMSIDDARETIADFDSIVLFGNNFGLFGTPRRARTLLRQWAAAAQPRARIFAESTSAYFGGAPGFDRSYYRRNLAKGVSPGHVRLRYRYGDVTSSWFSWLFVSSAEMRKILRGTGWHQSLVITSHLSEPYVAILEKD